MTEKSKMTEQEINKAVNQTIIDEGYHKHNLDVTKDLVADDFVDHNPIPGQGPGREGWKETVKMALTSFPDLRIEMHDIIAEGDLVSFRGKICGTNTGPLEHVGLPATGKKIAVDSLNLGRFKDGKIVERWLLRDEKQMAQQLGLLPPEE